MLVLRRPSPDYRSLLSGPEYDVVIRGGTVFDGSGDSGVVADLGDFRRHHSGDGGPVPGVTGATEIDAPAWPSRQASSTS